MSLFRYAITELRGRLSRTVPTLLASILAVSSFLVLTGTVERQRLEVTQLVNSNYRGAYDILVRPKGATSNIEASQQMVREDYLSGVFGGISLAQVQQIRSIAGVEVAAPIAMLGVTWRTQPIRIDVKKALKGRDRAVLRYVVHDRARNSTVAAQSWTGYIYLTRGKLTYAGTGLGGQQERISGKSVRVCLDYDMVADQPGSSVNDKAARWNPFCHSILDKELGPQVTLSYPLLMAAIDPDAENQLLGLSKATTTGRPLDTTTKRDYRQTDSFTVVPAVMSSQLNADYQTDVSVEALPDSLIEPLLAATSNQQRRELVTTAHGTPSGNTLVTDAATEYAAEASKLATASPEAAEVLVPGLWQPGQIRYTERDNVLHPVEVPVASRTWKNDAGGWYWSTPVTVADTSYRDMTVKPRPSLQTKYVALDVIGSFDPSSVGAGENGSGLLGSYSPEPLQASDPASSAVLGGEPLRSDLNPAGYVQDPPALLVSLDALDAFNTAYQGLNHADPVSAVRIRVSGVTGVDPVSRERIRVAAEQIQQATGLDVDVTLGSSVTYRAVGLPATVMGTPALQLKEAWVKKGVAVTIADALDTKSLALFILVLISAALTVAIAATASVRARRRELAILSCLGWRPGRLRVLVLTEALLLGLAAGVLGAGIAIPAGQAFGLPVEPRKLWLAIPIACVLNVAGALGAAVDAGRSGLVASMDDVSRLARVLRLEAQGPVGVGVTMLAQRPRHLLLGAVAVAVGSAAVTVVIEINWIFAGTVVGSVLGDAVAVQTQISDLVAVFLLAVLALISVGVVLFTGTTEDAQALAALRAIGWRDRSIALLINSQGAIVGLIGATIGALVGVTTMVLTFGASPVASLPPAGAIWAAAILAASGAALPVARRQASRSLAASLVS